MPDPRVEDGVEDVDEEVHEHVHDRDDRDEALDRDELPGADRLDDLLAQTRQPEDALDDDRATDERADVEAGDGEQREARRAQRVAPQDAACC